jgi:ABC-type transport system involved in multi-copper enzyme maturation permease subunit
MFVFDAICGEKERGTLKVLLSNSVPRDLVLLGKWIGGYISLAIPFLIALLGGIAYVYITGALQFKGKFCNDWCGLWGCRYSTSRCFLPSA